MSFVKVRVVAGRSRTRAGSPQAVSRRPCHAVALRITAWSEHGMASVNQTRPHFVSQMGKTYSKPLAARHGRGTAWTRHSMCKSALTMLRVMWRCVPDASYECSPCSGCQSVRSAILTLKMVAVQSCETHGTCSPPTRCRIT